MMVLYTILVAFLYHMTGVTREWHGIVARTPLCFNTICCLKRYRSAVINLWQIVL